MSILANGDLFIQRRETTFPNVYSTADHYQGMLLRFGLFSSLKVANSLPPIFKNDTFFIR